MIKQDNDRYEDQYDQDHDETGNDDLAQGGQTGLWRLLLEVDETEGRARRTPQTGQS